MWEVSAYFRWAEILEDAVYDTVLNSKRKALHTARLWMENGMEVERKDKTIVFVPPGSIHYIQVREITS